MTSGPFLPICNVCLTDIEGGTQGYLMSCGHFICLGCCRGGQPSVCPHCGSRGRAAVLSHPPAEVRDYLQSPLAQFRMASDVVMFQLDHFRAAAKQASKSLHELRLLYSHEVKRREDAENEALTLRQKAAAAATTLRGGRGGGGGGGDGFTRSGGASSGEAFRGNGRDTARDGGASPIGKLRQRFFGTNEVQKESIVAGTTTVAAPSHPVRQRVNSAQKPQPQQQQQQQQQQQHQHQPMTGRTTPLRVAPGLLGLPVADALTALAPNVSIATGVGSSPGQHKQVQSPAEKARRPQLMVESGGASAVVAAGSGARPSMSFSGPQAAAAARPVDVWGGKKPDTPQLASAGYHPSSSPARLRGASVGQRPQQGIPAAMPQQRPETPGRPTRPAWQNRGSVRVGAIGTGIGAAAEGGRAEPTARPSTPRNAQLSSPLAQQQQQQQQQRRRPQMLAGVDGARRPPPGQGHAGDDGGCAGLYAAATPRTALGVEKEPSSQVGLGRPTSSPPSPLLAVRGPLKRPPSGRLPSPKRLGMSSRERIGAQQGRPGTPLTPSQARSPTSRLRSPQMPFMAPSVQRPPPGQRPSSTSSDTSNASQNTPWARAHRPRVANIPSSPEAAGLFAAEGRR